jgi:hypothetical protein
MFLQHPSNLQSEKRQKKGRVVKGLVVEGIKKGYRIIRQ